jgi:hypothetical protein
MMIYRKTPLLVPEVGSFSYANQIVMDHSKRRTNTDLKSLSLAISFKSSHKLNDYKHSYKKLLAFTKTESSGKLISNLRNLN